MENLRRVKLTSPLDVCVVDINMVYYALAYGGVPYFEAPLSTIEPFESLYPDDDSVTSNYYKRWKI